MAELVKQVALSMPGAKIEQILDEVRRLTLKVICDDLKTKTFSSSMEVMEHLGSTYDLTDEDVTHIMKSYDEITLPEIYQFFKSKPTDTIRCFPWKRRSRQSTNSK